MKKQKSREKPELTSPDQKPANKPAKESKHLIKIILT